MKSYYARIAARISLDVALGGAAFVLVLIFYFFSRYASFLPVAEAERVSVAAFAEKQPRISPEHALRVGMANHWYLEAVLPAVVGIALGFVVGLLRRAARPIDALVVGLAYAATLGISSRAAFYDFAGVVGPILFTFCIMGSTALGQSLRAPRAEKAEVT